MIIVLGGSALRGEGKFADWQWTKQATASAVVTVQPANDCRKRPTERCVQYQYFVL
jgi:hypothetical protein